MPSVVDDKLKDFNEFLDEITDLKFITRDEYKELLEGAADEIQSRLDCIKDEEENEDDE